MKKALAAVLALVMALALCTSAWAEGDVSGTMTGDEFIQKAVSGKITLTGDVTLTSMATVNTDLTIDLNGKNISRTGNYAICVKSGTLTLKGTGKIEATATDIGSAVVYVGFGKTDAGIVVGENVTITGNGCYAMVVADSSTTAKLTADIYGTLEASGTSGANEAAALGTSGNSGAETDITVYDGATITSKSGVAIYHPQPNGTLTISGGTITGGNVGIEMRAGTLIVNGGTIKTTGTYAPAEANGNGSTGKGVALIASEHTTEQGVSVTVNGGTIDGGDKGKAVSVENPQNNTSENPPVTANLKGGIVKGDVISSDTTRTSTISVTGGTYNTDVSTYAGTTPVAELKGTYYVGTTAINAAVSGMSSGEKLTVVKGPVTIGNKEYAKGDTYTEPSHYYLNYSTTTETTDSSKTSPKTFDAGIAMYVGMAVMSVTGMAYVGKKKF